MKVLGWFFAVMLVLTALFAAGVDNRCPKGYVWSDNHKRCVTAPPEEKEGACTKSAKPWMLNCSTRKKPNACRVMSLQQPKSNTKNGFGQAPTTCRPR